MIIKWNIRFKEIKIVNLIVYEIYFSGQRDHINFNYIFFNLFKCVAFFENFEILIFFVKFKKNTLKAKVKNWVKKFIWIQMISYKVYVANREMGAIYVYSIWCHQICCIDKKNKEIKKLVFLIPNFEIRIGGNFMVLII